MLDNAVPHRVAKFGEYPEEDIFNDFTIPNLRLPAC